MARRKRKDKVTIRDGTADGAFLRVLPEFTAKPFRSLSLRFRKNRQERLLRAVANLYPALGRIEKIAIPKGPHYLDRPFQKALNNDAAIERGLVLFDAAWTHGLVELRGEDGAVIEPEDRYTAVAACGVDVSATERFFLYRAARIICRKHKKVKFNRKGMIKDVTALPLLRKLAEMERPGLDLLYEGMDIRFRDLLLPTAEDIVKALCALKPYHIQGLSDALGSKFPEIADWRPEVITAMGEHFSCAEQIGDLGELVVLLTTPEKIAAIGEWTVRDVTEKTNEDRKRRGLKPVDRAHETDIAITRKLLGREFVLIMEQPPELLKAVGEMIAGLRDVPPGRDRTERVDSLRKFAQRYLGFMTPQALEALQLVKSERTRENQVEPLTFSDALGILEGLFSKPGVGKVFFEEHLKTEEGVAALRDLVDQFSDMQARGSIKKDTDVAAIISTSDLFDSSIERFIRRT